MMQGSAHRDASTLQGTSYRVQARDSLLRFGILSDLIQIGTHRLRIEPDLVWLQLQGTVGTEDAGQILDLLGKRQREVGALYLLFDNNHSPVLSADARRAFVHWHRSNPFAGVANFGGGVVQRTVALLMVNAIRIMGYPLPAQTYAESEAAAREWIAQRRQQSPAPV